tara:strand:+ start:251 stop:358 length:108 start_codon:yes stop_codon:yes gene_type:complete
LLDEPVVLLSGGAVELGVEGGEEFLGLCGEKKGEG